MRDERTTGGVEALILSTIFTSGGFSVWWADESTKRSAAIERLEKNGKILRTGGAYPFLEYEVL